MWLTDTIHRIFNRASPTVRYEIIRDRGNGYYSWGGNLYHSDIIRACLRPHTTAIGKLTAQHIGNPKGYKYIDKILIEPNCYMSMQDLQEKLAANLTLNRNAFAYINRKNGYPVEIYPLDVTCAEALYDKSGYLYLRFAMANGKSVTYPYTDVIHLRKDFCKNDIFGENPKAALGDLMDIVSTSDTSLKDAVKNGAVIRWLLKLSQNLKEADVAARAARMEETYLQNNRSVLAIDSSAQIEQIKPTDYVPNALQTDRTLARVYNFFGVNEKLLQNSFDENIWTAFYEQEVEPVAQKLSDEFTRKLFTPEERLKGHRLIFSSNNLTYASMDTKLALQAMVDRGALTPNEWREILNLAPVPDGDKPLRRLDTETVEQATESNTKETKKGETDNDND